MKKNFDPIKLSEEMQKYVVKDTMRKYYRLVRGGKWYGGIATSDCCGCNLRCIFCWSNYPRDHPQKVGRFYTPVQIFNALNRCASSRGYRLLRISGNEPTLGFEHLLRVLELVEEFGRYTFILETNGILIGYNKLYAKKLSKFKRLHVRVSIKGATPEEFSLLTGAKPNAFHYQLKALQNLLDYNVECHPAVMLSFSTKENVKKLMEKLMEIDPILVNEFEEEYVFLYPHVIKRLKRARIRPLISYKPNSIPIELI